MSILREKVKAAHFELFIFCSCSVKSHFGMFMTRGVKPI